MTALAAPDDLAARLGRELTQEEEARVTVLLDDASAAVRSYTGQQFTTGEYTSRLPVKNGRIKLPQRPVTEVDTVEDVEGADLDFTWDAGDTVYLEARDGIAFQFEMVPRRSPIQYVDVTYTAGYEETPGDILAVVCSIAARAFGTSPEMSGVTSQTIGDASMSFGTVGAAGPVGMLPDERAVLDRYRRVGGTIRTA